MRLELSNINIKTPPILEEEKAIYFPDKEQQSFDGNITREKNKKSTFVMKNLRDFVTEKINIFNEAKIGKFEIKLKKKMKKIENLPKIRESKFYENFEIQKRIHRILNCKHDYLISSKENLSQSERGRFDY